MYSEELKRQVLWYYKAEWKEACFMLIWGGVHVLVSMSLLFINRSDFWLGWSIAMLPLAAIQSYTGLRNFLFFENRKSPMLIALEQETKKVVEAEKVRVLNTQIRLKFYHLIGQFLFVIGPMESSPVVTPWSTVERREDSKFSILSSNPRFY